MTEITASLVRELRETSGAGMMDCKKALVESGGDMEAAVDWLRKKGLSAAAKKSGRVAAEGLIGTASAPGVAAMVEVNAETDFVARNESFQNFVAEMAGLALLDACVRLLPGVMGAAESALEESHAHGLLEYPHYTRPASWLGRDVPAVLLSGHHAEVARWRREQAEAATRERRPDLWTRHQVAGAQAAA